MFDKIRKEPNFRRFFRWWLIITTIFFFTLAINHIADIFDIPELYRWLILFFIF